MASRIGTPDSFSASRSHWVNLSEYQARGAKSIPIVRFEGTLGRPLVQGIPNKATPQ